MYNKRKGFVDNVVLFMKTPGNGTFGGVLDMKNTKRQKNEDIIVCSKLIQRQQENMTSFILWWSLHFSVVSQSFSKCDRKNGENVNTRLSKHVYYYRYCI